MLLTHDEMHFDFKGAKLRPKADPRDRDIIAWGVQQFLYGEVTGIQVGHWIYHAPDLDAAKFLSKQAIEEFQHVGNFLRILDILGVPPAKAHPVVRFLTTGMMGGSWEEHVALEMALGEGLVLQAFYAMIELIDEPEIVGILKRGVKQEETHVSFGEERTLVALRDHPELRRRLLGLSLVSLFGVGRLADYMKKKLPQEHPALRQLPAFVEHTVNVAELRLRRLGVLDRPLADISGLERARLIAEAYAGKAVEGGKDTLLSPLRALPFFAPKKLTDTYLDDPAVRGYQHPNKRRNLEAVELVDEPSA
jgi:hypothetical protein